MAATPQDPYDWAGIHAAMEADPALKFKVASEQAQAANPNPTAKQLLDAFRALNGGALPPGMTPEQAQMIDSGMEANVLAANPLLMFQLQQLTAARGSTAADFAAAKAAVGENYQKLTGDVEQQGTQWMADLAARMGITPEQAAMDPTINQYGQTIANMGETADQNQATDQAWFDKMALAYDQQLQGMGIALQGNAAELAGGGGGGGSGGGGYGRGGRGGGGGGSDSTGWSDPNTTDTVVASADADASRNYPGYTEAVMAEFADDPEALEMAIRYLTREKGFPHNVAAGIIPDLERTELLMEAMNAQRDQGQIYRGLVPAKTEAAQTRLGEYDAIARQNAVNAPGGAAVPTPAQALTTLGVTDINNDKVVDRKDLTPEQLPQYRALTNTGQYLNEVQRAGFNQDFGIAITNMLADANENGPRTLSPEQWKANAPREGQSGVDWAKGINALGANPGRAPTTLEKMLALAGNLQLSDTGKVTDSARLRLAAQAMQTRRDKEQYKAASQDPNFTYEGWEGYVEPVDRDEEAGNLWENDVLRRLYGHSLDFSPNMDLQDTKLSLKDSSDTKTVATSRDPMNQLFDPNETPPSDEYLGSFEPEVAAPAPAPAPATSSPMVGGGTPGYAPTGGRMNLSESANRIIQNRIHAAAAAAGVGPTEDSKWDIGLPVRKPVAPTAKKPATNPWVQTATKAAAAVMKPATPAKTTGFWQSLIKQAPVKKAAAKKPAKNTKKPTPKKKWDIGIG